MIESDNFWEVIAAVVPVLALAFVLELRSVEYHRMGPFARLHLALTHALTLLILLASEAAALMHLQGARQAPWAESFAMYGCLTSLTVILITPTGRLLIIALHGTFPSDYVSYWRVWKRLRAVRRELRAMGRLVREGDRTLKRLDRHVAKYEKKDRALAGKDLQSIWQKEVIRAGVAELQASRADFVQSREQRIDRTRVIEKKIGKLERKLVKQTGARTKRIMSAWDKPAG